MTQTEKYRQTILSFFILLCCTTPVLATEATVSPGIDTIEGEDSIDSTLEHRDSLDYDPTRHSLFPDIYNDYRLWREQLQRKIGLEMTWSYDMLGQTYINKDWDQSASSGDISLTGRWLLFGYKYLKPVFLSFRIRHRHAYGDRAPSQLSTSTGLLWKTVDGFTDAGFQIPDLYISQELAEKKLTLRYGQFGIDKFFDNHKLRSSKRYFLNQAFSANPSVAFPSYGAGFAIQWKNPGKWDLSFGGSNIQGTSDEKNINLHLDSSALFYTVQGGYNFAGMGNHDARAQVMVWDMQNNSEKELSDGNGASFTLEQEGESPTERYMFRLAFSEGGTTAVDRLIIVGWGQEMRKHDHFGFGFGAGRSSNNRNDWQGVAEMYYRWQVTKELLITPDLQIIAGESLNDGDALQIVAGLRGGFTF